MIYFATFLMDPKDMFAPEGNDLEYITQCSLAQELADFGIDEIIADSCIDTKDFWGLPVEVAEAVGELMMNMDIDELWAFCKLDPSTLDYDFDGGGYIEYKVQVYIDIIGLSKILDPLGD